MQPILGQIGRAQATVDIYRLCTGENLNTCRGNRRLVAGVTRRWAGLISRAALCSGASPVR